MAIDDDEEEALLQRELHWRSRPGDRRRPAGGNAIIAIGIVFTLVMWAISGLALAAFLGGPSGSGVIDPKSLVALVVFGVELMVAGAAASRVWVAIGPGARTVLRPFAFLGPWPMLIIGAIAAVMVLSIVASPFVPLALSENKLMPSTGLSTQTEVPPAYGGSNAATSSWVGTRSPVSWQRARASW